MNKAIFAGIALILVAVMLFGCIQAPAVANNTNTTANGTQSQELTPADMPALNTSIDKEIQDMSGQLT